MLASMVQSLFCNGGEEDCLEVHHDEASDLYGALPPPPIPVKVAPFESERDVLEAYMAEGQLIQKRYGKIGTPAAKHIAEKAEARVAAISAMNILHGSGGGGRRQTLVTQCSMLLAKLALHQGEMQAAEQEHIQALTAMDRANLHLKQAELNLANTQFLLEESEAMSLAADLAGLGMCPHLAMVTTQSRAPPPPPTLPTLLPIIPASLLGEIETRTSMSTEVWGHNIEV